MSEFKRANDLLRAENERLRERLEAARDVVEVLNRDRGIAEVESEMLRREVESLKAELATAHEAYYNLRTEFAAAQNKSDISYVIKEAEGKGLILHHNGYTLLVPEVKKVDIEHGEKIDDRRLWDEFYQPRLVNRVVVEW